MKAAGYGNRKARRGIHPRKNMAANQLAASQPKERKIPSAGSVQELLVSFFLFFVFLLLFDLVKIKIRMCQKPGIHCIFVYFPSWYYISLLSNKSAYTLGWVVIMAAALT